MSLLPARQDGRPLYFDTFPGSMMPCFVCRQIGLQATYLQSFMNDPANPPPGAEAGSVHTVCKHHLPDDVVIYNPQTEECRNKEGTKTWTE